MAAGLIVNNKIESDKTIEIAPFKKEIRKTIPHKHNNYFEIE
jgi:AraC family transcriptional activator of pobA